MKSHLVIDEILVDDKNFFMTLCGKTIEGVLVRRRGTKRCKKCKKLQKKDWFTK